MNASVVAYWIYGFRPDESDERAWSCHYDHIRDAICDSAAAACAKTLILVGAGSRPCTTDLDVVRLKIGGLRDLILIDYSEDVMASAACDLQSNKAEFHIALKVMDITQGSSCSIASTFADRSGVSFLRAASELVRAPVFFDLPLHSHARSADLPILVVYSMCLASTLTVEYKDFLDHVNFQGVSVSDLESAYASYNATVLRGILLRSQADLDAGASILLISDTAWVRDQATPQFHPNFISVIAEHCPANSAWSLVSEWIWEECAEHGHLVSAILISRC